MPRLHRIARRAAACALAAAPLLALAGPARAADLLPDLRIEKPKVYGFDATEIRGRTLFRFTTQIGNVGRGPLTVVGTRLPDLVTQPGEPTPVPHMTAVQRILQDTGTSVDVPLATTLVFATADGHNHFHVQGFARYLIRSLERIGKGGRTPVVRSAKIGFCPRDSERIPGIAGPPAPTYADNCGTLASTSVVTGIQPGWLDNYSASDFWQWVDVTGLPPGRYRLVQTVNPDGIIREASRANDTRVLNVRLPMVTQSIVQQTDRAVDYRAVRASRRMRAVGEMSFSHAGVARVDLFRVRGRQATLVRSFSRRVRAGVQRITWAGRDDRGRPAPLGVYEMKVTLRAQGATSDPVYVRLRVARAASVTASR